MTEDITAPETIELGRALEVIQSHGWVAGPGNQGQDLPILRQTLITQIGEVLTLLARRHIRAVAALPKIMTLVDMYSANVRAHDQKRCREFHSGMARDIWAEGEAAGWSRAVRKMSDEPNVERAPNPYDLKTRAG